MITQIATFQLKATASLADLSSPASKVIREFLQAQLATPGAHHAYYGQYIEKPDMVIIFVNWESADDHKKFTSSPDYQNHTTHLLAIASPTTPPTTLHVPFTPTSDITPALGAHPSVGATEIVFFYFPSTLTPAAKSSIMASVDKMRPVMERSESLCVYDGWALEMEVPSPVTTEGEEHCQVFVNVVGWVDVDAHMRFQASEDFGSNIHHLLGITEMRHTEFFHAKLIKV